MKNILVKYLGAFVIMTGVFSSCKKESENIFNMFDDVDVVYHSDSPYALTGYKEVAVGDSIHLDFTITSNNKSMHTINVWEAGSGTPFLRIKTTPEQRKSFSHVVKLKMDTKVGETSYRVWATDSAGTYIGDGYKTVTVNVISDFNYLPNRYLYVPDTLGQSSPSYLSLTTGELFSYKEGAANSDKIDMGIVFVPRSNPTSSYPGDFIFYSLDASPLPFTPYDISAWNKRSTLFSNRLTNQANTWNNTLRTGAKILSGAASSSGLPKNKSVSMTHTNGTTANNFVYFKTAEGKIGAIFVKSITRNSPEKGTYAIVHIKLPK